MDGQISLFEIADKPQKFHEAEWLRGHGFKNIYDEKPSKAGLYEWADIECPTKTKKLEYTKNGISLGRLAMGSFNACWWRPIEQDRKAELEAKYQIPRKYQKEEGWTDDWHYTELETPTESGIYYCISHLYNSEYWNYTYLAWAYGNWWAYAGYGDKWLLVRGKRREWMKPFAWVTVPDLYYRTDEHHQFLCEHFVTKEDWEYEERIERLGK